MQLKLSQKLHVQSFDQFFEVEGKYNLKFDGLCPKHIWNSVTEE